MEVSDWVRIIVDWLRLGSYHSETNGIGFVCTDWDHSLGSYQQEEKGLRLFVVCCPVMIRTQSIGGLVSLVGSLSSKSSKLSR